jgi:hypothetical protein
MSKEKYIIIFLGEGIACWFINTTKLAIPCLFKLTIHISCPGCGMTRAFRQIFNLNFLEAFNYNILAIPLFIILILLNILLLIDAFKNSNKARIMIKRIISHPIFIFIFILLSEIFNIYRGI